MKIRSLFIQTSLILSVILVNSVVQASDSSTTPSDPCASVNASQGVSCTATSSENQAQAETAVAQAAQAVCRAQQARSACFSTEITGANYFSGSAYRRMMNSMNGQDRALTAAARGEAGNSRDGAITSYAVSHACQVQSRNVVVAIQQFRDARSRCQAIGTFAPVEDAQLVAIKAEIDGKAAENNATAVAAGLQEDAALDSLERASGGVGGFISNNWGKMLVGGAAGVGLYMLGKKNGEKEAEKNATKDDDGNSDDDDDDDDNDDDGTNTAQCTDPANIKSESCATYFSGICYANPTAAGCTQFNSAYCEGTSTAEGAISAPSSVYCTMRSISQQCSGDRAGDTPFSCNWYASLSPACKSNLSKVTTTECLPQVTTAQYQAQCASNTVEYLCRSIFSGLIGTSSTASIASNSSSGSSSTTVDPNAPVTGEFLPMSVIGSGSAASRNIAAVSDILPAGGSLIKVAGARVSQECQQGRLFGCQP